MAPPIDVAIVTKSASRLADFYRSVIGLEPAGEVRVSGVLPDGVLMRFRTGGSTLKILQFDVDPIESAPGDKISEATGMRYLTVRVEDLSATLERCESLGIDVALPITALNDEVAIAFVRDPDGNHVELVGPPTKTPSSPIH